MSEHPIYADDLRKIAACLPHLEALSEALGDDYVGGEVRIWNANGWSPGYFSDTELGWTFTPKYEEKS